jgi:hypothetical protein
MLRHAHLNELSEDLTLTHVQVLYIRTASAPGNTHAFSKVTAGSGSIVTLQAMLWSHIEVGLHF